MKNVNNPKEAIAIIGIGCRYPGASDVASLWRILRDGESTVGEIPEERFGPIDNFFDDRPATPGRLMSRYGGFLKDIERFDADFFGISPLEARQLDPQQRVLLEVAWEALEDAGIPPSRLSGTSAGVFIGSWLQDFETRLIGDPLADDLRKLDLYTTTGSGRYPLAGRLSYFLGLNGPSLVVDTACSSSLVAIHLACSSLLQNESEIALAGGINIILTPYITVAYSQSKMMAPDGRCKFGDASADGYVRSEGCGVVVLKPLAKAMVDGDSIYAVIHGSAVNNDGRTSGYLTTPGAGGQEDVLAKAYRNAGVTPSLVNYVEAHGTGTRAGDPIELGALGAVLSEGRPAGQSCLVGSIKTNLGHTEGAAGVAGLIKVALAIQHREIPASLNHINPNPNVPWEDLSLKVPTQTIPWPSNQGPMIAGVSGFGITGTNAHVVLGEAPVSTSSEVDRCPAMGRMAGKWLFPLSAHSFEALREMALRVHAQLASIANDSDAPTLEELCATAALKREHHDYRIAVVIEERNRLGQHLGAFADGETGPGVVVSGDRVRPKGKLAFVYPGQGSQWLGMCRDLMQHADVFRQTMQRCDTALKPFVDWSLLEQLDASEFDSRLDDISVVQPVLFAIQVALTEQWRAWGVTPDAVIGHSMGEPAAAFAAGVLDLRSAAKIITARSRLMKRTSGRGAMALVELTMEEAAEEIKGREKKLSIAVSNSPRSTVLSGDPAALDELLGELETRQVFCRKINVDVASHSPQMEPLRGELVAALDGLIPQSTIVPIYSTVAGGRLENDAFEAAYWGDNLCRPVRFAETIARMLADGHTIFIEMSPHPILLRAIDECAQADASEQGRVCTTIPSLQRKKNEPATIMESLGRLYILGHPFDWRGLYSMPGQHIGFPAYAWQRERHWFEETAGRTRSRRISSSGDGRRRHALLEHYISSSMHPDLHLWESELDTERLPWLKDHSVQGHLVFPAAAFVETAAAAAAEALGGPVELSDLEICEALFLDRNATKRLQVVISKENDGSWGIRMLSRPSDTKGGHRPWREHVRGWIAVRNHGQEAPVIDVEAVRARCMRLIPGDRHFTTMQRLQVGYGPAFRGIERIGLGKTEAVARIRAPQAIAADSHDFRIHPALLDAGLQLLVSLACGGDEEVRGGFWMPVRVEKACLYPSQTVTDELWAVCKAREDVDQQSDFFTGDLFLLDQAGRVLSEVRGVGLRKIAYSLGEDVDQWLYEMTWQARPLSVENDDGQGLLTGPEEVARRVLSARLPDQLKKDGETATKVLPQLERLSIGYIINALVRLGMRFEMDQSFAVDELVADLHIHERHRRLLGRMLAFLQEEGILETSGDAMHVARRVSPKDYGELEERLLSQYPQCRVELTMLQRCGRKLAEALTGEVDPLELLFPDGSMEEAESFYRDSVFARAANHQAGLAIQTAIESLPDGRMLRILEIGSGTGGLTSHVLPLLPAGRTRYVFTDIGAAFVTRAREKYKDVTWMEYGVLDIEKDPVAQGFEPNRFDIVLAANCLHATRDMHVTLNHVRLLLAPGGLMLLLEGTRPRRWIDLIFGLTEGWWLFEDVERRPSHPLMNAGAWKTMAADSGFAEAAVFQQIEAVLFDQSVVAARAPADEVPSPDRPVSKSEGDAWLVFADRGGLGAALAKVLDERGDYCRLIVRGSPIDGDAAGGATFDPSDPNHFERTLEQFEKVVQSERRTVVFLWPLDEADGVTQSAVELQDSQKTLCGGLLQLVQAMARREDSRRSRLWVVSRQALPTGQEGPDLSLPASALAGLVKAIDLEHPELRCRMMDLSGDLDAQICHLLDELAADDNEALTAYRAGLRLVPRMIKMGDRPSVDDEWLPLPAEGPARLINENRGTLDGLRMVAMMHPVPGPGEVTIQVRAAGLNFRDVVSALGMIPDNDDPGLECAGRITAVGAGVTDLAVGDDVIAVAPGAFATIVQANAAMVAPIPEGVSYEQAATIPIAFLTAYHALIGLAKLKTGERVLIHAASGGVGQAAVQIAKARGAIIFGTAGTPAKRTFLTSIGVDHVLDSRSLEFATRIDEITAGKGVDVVLNSLSGEFIERSFAVLCQGGRFIEIGKRDIWTTEKARQARPDAFYTFFDLAGMVAEEPERVRPIFDLLLEKFHSGELKPLHAMIWPMEQVIRAYRTMQQAGHIGKIVVNLPPWSGAHRIDAPDAFSKDGTYLITGAFGGIGLGLAKWLCERGAMHLALIGHNAPQQAAAKDIAQLEAAGARVCVATCDVASEAQVESLFARDLVRMPPLRGVFHLAGALEDGALIQQSWLRFETVFAPKVLGAWNLHRRTCQLPLDCFVLFSSWASFLGSQGQANHSAANAFMDALAWQRRAAGLPGLSINWGAWAEIGAATKGDAAEHLGRRGIGSFSPEMGFRALGRLMSQGAVQAAVTPFDLKKWRHASAAADRSTWFEFLEQSAEEAAEAADDAPAAGLKQALLATPPGKPRYLVMESFLKEQVGKTLRLPLSRIDADKPFKSFGMDSLTALEFRNRIEAATEATLSATLVWNYPTIGRLAPFLFEKMAISIDQQDNEAKPSTAGDGDDAAVLELLDAVEQMSDDEARQLLNE